MDEKQCAGMSDYKGSEMETNDNCVPKVQHIDLYDVGQQHKTLRYLDRSSLKLDAQE